VLLANSYESSMPYYLVGSDVNFVFTDDSDPTYSSIQYDNGGIVSTLYAPSGLHAYYPIALNGTRFYYSQSDSANHDQVYLGDISGTAAQGPLLKRIFLRRDSAEFGVHGKTASERKETRTQAIETWPTTH